MGGGAKPIASRCSPALLHDGVLDYSIDCSMKVLGAEPHNEAIEVLGGFVAKAALVSAMRACRWSTLKLYRAPFK